MSNMLIEAKTGLIGEEIDYPSCLHPMQMFAGLILNSPRGRENSQLELLWLEEIDILFFVIFFSFTLIPIPQATDDRMVDISRQKPFPTVSGLILDDKSF
ncbi:hypothetical protein CEXT_808381 [Caerostris extrusa]|uniref:Uncharacterized protein n=1 Tax=Caerostris extrusa TaxID=172846 RepID=A0AAV4N9N3_CAEEX|nr:hypothetical protein CEXT_808381 [Caerostris extrusa]